MLGFEQYLEQFTNTINLFDFVVALIVTTVLAFFIRLFYIRYGNAVSNRQRFADNFLPLALTTMLIITIVKSSIALSLGLVGALSIVRFRAAIKDPEELTYLFLIIGLGLAAGANHIIIAVIAIFSILFLLFVNKKINGKVNFRSEDRMYINISTDTKELLPITDILTETLSYVKLKRMDTLQDGLDLSFICKAKSLTEIDVLSQKIRQISPKTHLSIIDEPDLIV
ncbi:MAG: DUF4956 domain-containing protein [Chitinophagales bacterium]